MWGWDSSLAPQKSFSFIFVLCLVMVFFFLNNNNKNKLSLDPAASFSYCFSFSLSFPFLHIYFLKRNWLPFLILYSHVYLTMKYYSTDTNFSILIFPLHLNLHCSISCLHLLSSNQVGIRWDGKSEFIHLPIHQLLKVLKLARQFLSSQSLQYLKSAMSKVNNSATF